MAASPRANRSPYAIEELTILLRRSRAGIAWRWRTELAALTGGSTGFLECWHCIGLDWTGFAFGGGITLAAALPPVRARFWCLVTRHRLQRAFWECKLHTRAGHLPLVLFTRPVRTGERAFVVARAGLTAADFEDAAPAFASACGAREARVSVSPRWSQLITIDILRRDFLAPGNTVPSPLAAMTGPVRLPAPPSPAGSPGPSADDFRWPQAPEGDDRP